MIDGIWIAIAVQALGFTIIGGSVVLFVQRQFGAEAHDRLTEGERDQVFSDGYRCRRDEERRRAA